MRVIVIVVLALLALNVTAQQKQFDPDEKYHADSLKDWTKSVMEELSRKHPGFYRYTPKVKFDNLIDSTAQTINDHLTVLDYYRKLKPLFAQIGCLHTGITLSEEYQDYLAKTPTLIPFEVFIDSANKILVTKNYGVDKIQTGSEVISINDRPASEVLMKLLKAIPSDGFNRTEKILLLNHRFSFWYQTVIEVTENFKVEMKTNGVVKTLELKGVSSNVFPTQESIETNYKKPLEFEVVNNIGILKVHSFAKSTVKKHGQHFKKFTRRTFKRLNKEGIKYLIVDLRYNSGGSDGNAVYLASYFFDKPFRYWDKIEVTEGLAQEVKGVARLFYRKPVKEGESYKWQKGKLTNEFDYYRPQKPARHYFRGEAFILTNGLCLSSCSDFTAILSHNQKAQVIGQESGGGYQGNNSGLMPTTKIPTGLLMTVPLLKYTNAVDLNKNFGRGTIPDFEIVPTFDDWINRKDVEMEFALRLANGN